MSVSVSVHMNTSANVITARQRSCGKVMFSRVSVCPEGGGYLWFHVWRVTHQSEMGPQGVGTHPPPHGIQWDMVSKWAVRILLECFLVVSIKPCDRSGTLNSNTVNSKFHLIRSFFEIFARFLSFHV